MFTMLFGVRYIIVKLIGILIGVEMDKIITDISILRQVSKETSLEECRELDIFPRLEETLANNGIKGIGLAAIQIGIPMRASIIRLPKFKANLINPKILRKEDQRIFKGEGCLSVPGKYIKTHRYQDILAEWEDCDGEWKDYREGGSRRQWTLYGLPAVVFQHELDHMDGVLFVDHGLKPEVSEEKIGRNDPCPCGSGKKYKKCCI
jgi:peptide deformylase